MNRDPTIVPVTRRGVIRVAGVAPLPAAIAGCTGGDGDDTTPTPAGLDIAEVVFCAEQPDGYDDYTVQPEATYAVGDVIWIYIDVLNVATDDAGGGEISVEVTETLVIRDESESVVFEDTIELTQNFPEGIDMTTFFLVNDVLLPMEAGAGEYELVLSLTDDIGESSTSATASFTLEG